jgi:hypothetical protein
MSKIVPDALYPYWPPSDEMAHGPLDCALASRPVVLRLSRTVSMTLPTKTTNQPRAPVQRNDDETGPQY